MSWPCWYERCESCAPFTVEAPLTCTADSVNFKEGAASIKVTAPNRPGDISEKWTWINAAQCDPYFGAWIRSDSGYTSGTASLHFRLRKADGSFAEVHFFNDPPLKYQFYVYDPIAGLMNSPLYGYTRNKWLWIEIYVKNGGDVRFFVDGVNTYFFAAWNVYPVEKAIIRCAWDTVDYFWADWMRWYPTQEYPPVPILPKLHPFWKLKV